MVAGLLEPETDEESDNELHLSEVNYSIAI